LHIVCKVGNITYDEQTHMRTINGKLNALAGSECINNINNIDNIDNMDNIDGSLKLIQRRS